MAYMELYWDDEKENGNYYIIIRYILGYIGIIGVYIGVILG